MTATMKYPHSRIMSSGQCKLCKPPAGMMTDAGRLLLQDTSGNTVELMRWTCNKCGHTLLFDLSVAFQRPFRDQEYEEILPDRAA